MKVLLRDGPNERWRGVHLVKMHYLELNKILHHV